MDGIVPRVGNQDPSPEPENRGDPRSGCTRGGSAAMSEAVWAGVDIGGTKTAVLLSGEPPAVLSRHEFPTLPAEGPQRAIELIIRTLRESAAGRPLRAIGVSCGGPLNSAAGIIQAPPNLWTWV